MTKQTTLEGGEWMKKLIAKLDGFYERSKPDTAKGAEMSIVFADAFLDAWPAIRDALSAAPRTEPDLASRLRAGTGSPVGDALLRLEAADTLSRTEPCGGMDENHVALSEANQMNPRSSTNASMDATTCAVCGGEFTSKRTIIDGRTMHPSCAIMSFGSHTYEDMARAVNLIWELRTALQKIAAKNTDEIATKALHDLFPDDRERDQHFIGVYASSIEPQVPVAHGNEPEQAHHGEANPCGGWPSEDEIARIIKSGLEEPLSERVEPTDDEYLTVARAVLSSLPRPHLIDQANAIEALQKERAVLSAQFHLMAERLASAWDEAIEAAEKCVPCNWLDPLLSGPEKIADFTCGTDLELLLIAIRKRIHSLPRPPSEGWRDISSAPKDGTRVLAYSAERCENCVDSSGMSVARWQDGAWICGRLKADGQYIRSHHQPTHWQPLSAPPDSVSHSLTTKNLKG